MFAIVCALVVGAGAVGWVLGSWADDDGATVDAPIVLPNAIQQWADAWSARDAVGFADAYEVDGSFLGVFGVTLAGQDEIRNGIDEYWTHEASQLRLTPAYFFDDGTVAVVVWNIEVESSIGTVVPDQRITNYEWDWDGQGLLRSSNQNW